ncbi:MAG: aminoacyl-tRNA hydrolase [Candidatus Taylorbacteria bacterium]|nr:aminoacyl-tRNA hydrolase [Candidatus Taylorbacteria bacterium]
MRLVVGLGNPGEEYTGTRHNAGREAVFYFARQRKFPDFEFDSKASALTSAGKIGGEKVLLILPETFMNKSGQAVKVFVKNAKQAEKLIVIHDDLDLPLGRIKLSFNKSSGGHRGVENVIENIKTNAFIRLRIGISKRGPKGIVKKPNGEKEVNAYILGKFKPAELEILKKEHKKIAEAIEVIVSEGRDKAMSRFNSS